MKELTIEQKAKAYDEAIERAKVIYQGNYKPDTAATIAETLQNVFPELCESEDERISKEIIKYLEQTVPHNHHDEVLKSKEWIAWLEKQGEQKPAWSEKDEKILKAIHNSVDVECLSKNELDYVVMVDWFNALKDRVQPKQEWSEEDATHYNRILKELNLQKEMPINASVIKEVKSDIIWFKSLRPQNTWKPSDEQITVLELASKYERVFTPKQIDILIGLKEQLKKLKGE